MDRFIKKNLFLVGVLAISAVGILLLLGMSAVKFFEMNKYQSETKKMTDVLDELNNRMRTPIPPFRKNVTLVQQDTEGYKDLKVSIQSYFGQTLLSAVTAFVTDLRRQSMEKLISLSEMADKSAELAKIKKDFAAANAALQKSLADKDKTDSELFRAYRNIKSIEEHEETQEGKARAVSAQQKKIDDLKKKLDANIAAVKGSFAAVNASYNKSLEFINAFAAGEKFKAWAGKSKEDAKEFDFYHGICKQDLTVNSLTDVFREYWNQVKDLQGPRKQTYRNFRLERGATLEQPANSKNKPALWDTEMWDNAILVFINAAQKSMLEKIDDKNLEEIFLSALGLQRNLDKTPALVDAHWQKMNAIVTQKLEKGQVFTVGVNFGQAELEQIKSNKGYVDTSSIRASATSQTNTNQSSFGNSGDGNVSTGMLTADPSDVIRNWEIIGDIVQRMITANIDQLERFSYVNLAGDSSNGNYKKYTYVFTVVSRESQIRTLMQLFADAYKDNRIYVVKRFSMKKQEDQIQDIIDYASGLIGKNTNAQNNDNSNSDEGKNIQARDNFFKETRNYPECVAGRSTLCRVTMVIDYVEITGNQLK